LRNPDEHGPLSTAPTPQGTGRRAGLDRADVVAGALLLIQNEGPGALTMRNLAAKLGVTTTTIYWHVGGRDDLVTEIIRHQSEVQAARPVEGTGPRDRLMSAARHIWESARDNRAITSLAHQNGASALLQHPLEVALVRELEAAGVTGPAAAAAHRSILFTIGGFLVQALRDESAIPAERRAAALWAASDEQLDPATTEALAARPDLDELFDATVRAVVDSHLPI